jgi:hypothetical protein
MKNQLLIVIAAVLFFSFAVSVLHAQGSLTPPGAPGPTMLTLTQVEPRTPVDAVHTPGNGSAEFIIANSGSYYLTTNIIGVSSENGIAITAGNVTLDLNGFSLVGPSTANTAIVISSGTTNVTVRNGMVSGWGTLNPGILSSGTNVSFEDLTISGASDGIECGGDGGVIKNCTISHVGQWGVFITGPNYLISRNYFFENNTGNNGNGAAIFLTSANNIVEDNHVTGSSPSGFGVSVNGIAGITNNVIIRNSVLGKAANNYLVPTGVNDVGPIGSASTNSNPQGNISN